MPRRQEPPIACIASATEKCNPCRQRDSIPNRAGSAGPALDLRIGSNIALEHSHGSESVILARTVRFLRPQVVQVLPTAAGRGTGRSRICFPTNGQTCRSKTPVSHRLAYWSFRMSLGLAENRRRKV